MLISSSNSQILIFLQMLKKYNILLSIFARFQNIDFSWHATIFIHIDLFVNKLIHGFYGHTISSFSCPFTPPQHRHLIFNNTGERLTYRQSQYFVGTLLPVSYFLIHQKAKVTPLRLWTE